MYICMLRVHMYVTCIYVCYVYICMCVDLQFSSRLVTWKEEPCYILFRVFLLLFS